MSLHPLSEQRRQRRLALGSFTGNDYSFTIDRLAGVFDQALQNVLGQNGSSGAGTLPTGSTGVRYGNQTGTGQTSLAGIPGLTNQEAAGSQHTDVRLAQDLQEAMQALGITVRITDAARPENAGYGAAGSRHKQGKALDIGLVNGSPATLNNPAAVQLAQWFINRGYTPGRETAGQPGLLFGPTGSLWNHTSFDHTTHLHVSVP